jgi:tRNA 2-thiouridine synthesizing protein A
LGYEGGMKDELDVKGLACPLPVLKAKKRLKAMATGDVLTVHATDSSAVKDFAAFCELTGHALLSSTEYEGIYTFELRRA